MKKFFVLILLLCLSFSSFAQIFGPRISSLPLATHEDSVAFIRHVFKKERRFQRLQTLTNGLLTANVVSSLATDQRVRNSAWQKSLAVGVSAGMGLATASYIQGWSRFSKRREEEAVRRFKQSQPQQPHVNQKLAAAFLRYNRNR